MPNTGSDFFSLIGGFFAANSGTVMLVVMMVVLLLVMIIPQRKRDKKIKEMQSLGYVEEGVKAAKAKSYFITTKSCEILPIKKED